ncbi:MAG TPA: hypothetical protein VFA09_00520 [Ktedonobacteraceae bacterium]|jgi:hypothetical protein|nr:hypothetical protein [Ktedonobacteraceae bacterium]
MLVRIRKITIGSYGLCAIALIALAVILRVVLIALGWPQHNSDESVMGLMALHIANRGELPIFFYGQSYMGVIEAYMAAALFHLFGASVFTLRLVPLLFFTCFLACMYLLTSLLYSKQLALVTLGLLVPGSNIVLQTEVVALGGYPEMLAFGALGFLLASWLALANDQFAAGHRRWRFSLCYALWGLAMGLGTWSDYLFVVFVFTSGLLLLVFCWRTLLSIRVWPFLLLGLLLGLLPVIIFNITNPAQNSLVTLLSLHSRDHRLLLLPHLFGRYPYESGIAGTLLVSLPSITGAPPLCYDSSLILYGLPTINAFQCLNATYNAWQESFTLLWSIFLLILWAIAVLQTLVILNRLRQLAPRREQPAETRRAVIRHVVRLALLLNAALFFIQFVLSPVAAVFPTNARYLTGLLVSTPAVIAPLWNIWFESEKPAAAGSNQDLRRFNADRLMLLIGRAVLLLAALVLLWGSISVFRDIPTIQASREQENSLMHDLLRIHATHIYTDYWTCYRLTFDSNEKITCVVLDQYLYRGDHDRYPAYDGPVLADPHAAYVFVPNAPNAPQIPDVERMAATKGIRLQRFTFDGIVVLQPI